MEGHVCNNQQDGEHTEAATCVPPIRFVFSLLVHLLMSQNRKPSEWCEQETSLVNDCFIVTKRRHKCSNPSRGLGRSLDSPSSPSVLEEKAINTTQQAQLPCFMQVPRAESIAHGAARTVPRGLGCLFRFRYQQQDAGVGCLPNPQNFVPHRKLHPGRRNIVPAFALSRCKRSALFYLGLKFYA